MPDNLNNLDSNVIIRKSKWIVNEKSEKSNKNLKYSLKIGNEDISGTVEETKNLVALHNLSEQNLLKVIDLGGFPMPSIAVTTTAPVPTPLKSC